MPDANGSAVNHGRIYGSSNFEKIMQHRQEWEKRFWPKISKAKEGCWEWIAGKNDKGYGVFSAYQISYKKPKLEYAHRLSFMLSSGKPIPSGMVVDHKCFNPSCCNPEHLQAIPISVNSAQHARHGLSKVCGSCGTERKKWPSSGIMHCPKCLKESNRRYKQKQKLIRERARVVQ